VSKYFSSVAATLVWLGVLAPRHLHGQDTDPAYLFYVASESEDEVTVLRFTSSDGLSREKVIAVGKLPAEMEAPHGIFMGPDKEYWYLTLGHGFPFGSLVKYEAGVDTVVATVELGMFPATVAVPPFGGLALAVNSDFHGDMVPSSVSVIDLESMTEIARTETCTMPHGSRFSPDGLKHYSACMMDDQLVEIDVVTLDVSRRLNLLTGQLVDDYAGHDMSMVSGRMSGGDTPQTCSPTWVAPTPDGSRVYVPCNKGNEVLEIDVGRFEIVRRFDAPGAPYNAVVTADGSRLVVTQKGVGAVSVWDLASGERVGLIENTRRVTHGVIVSPDGRFAFVTVEGIGGEPGTVDVIDLQTMRRVDSVDVGKQAGGITFWRMTS